MRVLHINCNYVGTALHRNMIENLDKKQIVNDVFVPVYKNNDSIKNDDKVIVSKCFHKWDRIFFNYKSKKIRSSLIKNYNMSKIDLIHAYTLFTDGNVAYRLKEKYNIPYVVAIRNTDVNTFMKYMVHLRKRGVKIMQEASAIFFLSNTYKKEIFNKYIPKNLWKELEEKTYIIPNGIADFWISACYIEKKEKKSDKHLHIIYAGRIDANKNIETTQKALEILRKRGYEISFSIVGKIENKKIFDRIMEYENTYYYESRNKDKLKDLYRENDIFVMPSLTETFGLVYAEAMSQGLPVIYTRGQGFDGQFEEGVVGYSVNSKNAEEIADRIIEILSKYQKISNNCVKYCKKFDWNIICQEYYDLYCDILKKKRSIHERNR